jgi:hypothetical protein
VHPEQRAAPVGKAMRAVDGAADRIGGLANICYSLSFGEMAKGAHTGEAALRCQLIPGKSSEQHPLGRACVVMG